MYIWFQVFHIKVESAYYDITKIPLHSLNGLLANMCIKKTLHFREFHVPMSLKWQHKLVWITKWYLWTNQIAHTTQAVRLWKIKTGWFQDKEIFECCYYWRSLKNNRLQIWLDFSLSFVQNICVGNKLNMIVIRLQ